jgi:hypothetical protein
VEFMRAFWTAAIRLDSAAADLREDRRFPFCTEDKLKGLAEEVGLTSVSSRAIEIDTLFADFDDFWRPFTFGAGPAPGYCMSLSDDDRARLKHQLQKDLISDTEGRIPMRARAWAVKGRA